MNKYDVIVIGTGISGLFCSINISDNLRVLLITKDLLDKSNSSLAQGGIATLKGKEDFNSYLEDTLKAGRYKNDIEAVKVMIRESTDAISELISLGVEFEKEDGVLKYTKEGAHSTNRILHHKDITGKEIINKLITNVKKRTNITIKEHCKLLDIIKDNNKCSGVILEYNNKLYKIYSDFIVLATGGIGGLFNNSTNYPHINGDGIAIAIKNNVKVKNINYIQIHPTALVTKEKGRRFLISEAVRGEGAYLINPNKERFVDELLPRDVVSNKIYEEMEKFNTNFMRLSVTHLGEQKIVKRFPNIYNYCLSKGYDITKESIPIAPAQHYFMGGIKVDLYGQTTLAGLFAIGETCCTGVHGVNRLASNSLLESLVFAKRVSNLINKNFFNYLKVKQCTNISNDDCIIENEQEKSKYLKDYNLHCNRVKQAIKREDNEFYEKWLKFNNC